MLSSAGNSKQFGPRPGLTKCQAWSGSKQFDTIMVFMKAFYEKLVFGTTKGMQDYLALCKKTLFSYFLTKMYVVGSHKNRLNEMVPFKHQRLMLKPMGKKAITILHKKCVYLNLYSEHVKS